MAEFGSEAYVDGLYLYTTGGAALAALSIVACTTTLCCKCFDCPEPVPKCVSHVCGLEKPVTSGQKCTRQSLVIILQVLILIGAVIGFVGDGGVKLGAARVQQGLVEVEGSIAFQSNLTHVLFKGIDQLAVMDGNVLGDNNYQNLMADLDAVTAGTARVSTNLDNLESIRAVGVSVAFVACVACAFIAIFNLCCQWQFFSFVLVSTNFLSLILIWLAFGLHLPLAVLINDTCTNVELAIADAGSAQVVRGCVPQASVEAAFGQLTVDTQRSLQTLRYDAELLGMEVFSSPPTVVRMDEEMVAAWNTYVSSQLSKVSIALAQIPLARAQENEAIIVAVEGGYRLVKTFQDLAAQLRVMRTCAYLHTAYVQHRDNLCVSMCTGLNIVVATQGFLGLLLLMTTYLALRGHLELARVKEPVIEGIEFGTSAEDRAEQASREFGERTRKGGAGQVNIHT